MKENFGIDSLSSIPSAEENTQQGRFDDLENLNSLTKSSLDLGLWSSFLVNTSHTILQSFSIICVYDKFYCHFSFIILFWIEICLLINLFQNIWKSNVTHIST